MSDPIEFWATISKIQTLADGGLRFTFDAGEQAIMAAAELMACKRMGVVVDVVVTARESVMDRKDETEKEPEGSSPDVDSRRITIKRGQRTSKGV